MFKPLVSVIVPCYNQARFLEETLESVFNQTYGNLECIIVNDGSTDNTKEVALKWVEKDERFKYFYKTNGGLSSARNTGLQNSMGDYIQFLDADDLLNENKLKFSIEKVCGHKNEIIITNFEYFYNNSSEASPPDFQLSIDFFNYQNILMLWPSNYFPPHSGLFSSDIFEDIIFPMDLKAWEDWVTWVKVLMDNPEITFINKPLVLYRKHPLNMTSDTFLMENYHLKAVNYILENIPLEKKIRTHFEELQKFKNKNRKLENTIKNYRNTRTFKFSEKLKNLKLFRILLNLEI